MYLGCLELQLSQIVYELFLLLLFDIVYRIVAEFKFVCWVLFTA